ncbi:hypothetical protein [Hoeflea sp.]|nr:hypothetical protein [Hoeflea sp.]MBV1785320.1 hypothetical protein [Hoeflea sp.]
MQAGVFRFDQSIASGPLIFDRHSSPDKRWMQPALDDVLVPFDIAFTIREDQIKFAFRTGQLPFLERIDHHRGEGDCPLPGI